MLSTKSVLKHLLRNGPQQIASFSTNRSILNATSAQSSKVAQSVDKYQELKKLKVRPLYLDAQATSPVDPRVLDAMLPYLTNMYGNPHSRTHAYGWESEKAVEDAREVCTLFILLEELLGFAYINCFCRKIAKSYNEKYFPES
jgi:hypothetical protein